MRIVRVVLLLIAAGIAPASAQEVSTAPARETPAASAAPAQEAPSTQEAPSSQPSSPSFAMDHGQAAEAAAAARAAAEAAKAKAAAIAAGVPLSPSQVTDFRVNGGDVIRVAPPLTPGQQKADAESRGAWQARCRPTVVTDREGLRRTRYAEPDCDISRFNTAGAQ